MPLPKKREDEEKKDFIPRCMADAVMVKEYEGQDQRYRVCESLYNGNVSMAAFKSDDELANALRMAFAAVGETFELEAEIFSTGKWNGKQFTKDDLQAFVDSFNTVKQVLKVPLKFGHNNEQPMTDGKPALGWVDSVWVKGNKLFAKFVDMPEQVYSAIKKKLYRHVSIEASFNAKYKGNLLKNVLTGVALLGADIPAVNNLKDLTSYMSAKPDDLSLGDASCFTYDSTKEGKKMDEVEKLKQKMKEQEDHFNAQLKQEKDAREKAEKEKAEFEETAKTEKFNTDKKAVTDQLDAMVKENKIIPAKRDELVNSIKDDETLSQVKFTADTLKSLNVKATDIEEGEEGKGGKGKESDTVSAEEKLLNEINKYSAEHGVDFATAQTIVYKANPDLAKEYIASNDEDDAA